MKKSTTITITDIWWIIALALIMASAWFFNKNSHSTHNFKAVYQNNTSLTTVKNLV